MAGSLVTSFDPFYQGSINSLTNAKLAMRKDYPLPFATSIKVINPLTCTQAALGFCISLSVPYIYAANGKGLSRVQKQPLSYRRNLPHLLTTVPCAWVHFLRRFTHSRLSVTIILMKLILHHTTY